MHTKRITRRHFTRYVSHSILGAALTRTFVETQAFGAQGRLKIMLCTTPNGHLNFEITKAALKSGMSQSVANQHGLFFKGVYNSCLQGDWHWTEGGLFGFGTSKGSKASFYTTIPNLEKTYLAVQKAKPPAYPRDSSGGEVKIITNPAAVLQKNFGLSLAGQNSFALADLRSGKKHVLDSSLDDLKRLRAELGSDGVIFDDHVYALQSIYEKHVPPDLKVGIQPNDPGGDGGSSGSTGAGGSSSGGSTGGGGVSPVDPGDAFKSPECQSNPQINPGMNDAQKHQAMLDVAFQLFACDISQVVVVNFCDSEDQPYHQSIHGDSTGTGNAFRAHLDPIQKRIAGVVERLGNAGGGILDRSAVVYISEGSAHTKGSGSFNPNHPKDEIPLAVFGKLGGAIKKTGDFDGSGDQRRLWKVLANGLAGGNADLSAIGGADPSITPFSV